MWTVTFQALFAGGAIVIASGAAAVAQNSAIDGPSYHTVYKVQDWRDIATEQAVEFKTFRTAVLSNQNYTEDEKAAKVKAKFKAIESSVIAERTKTYENVSELVTVGNSCTNQGSSPKNCDAKCERASLPNMYTRIEWVEGWWGGDVEPRNLKPNANRMGNDRISGDTYVCAGKLKQSGHGRKTSYAEGTFRIRPEHVKTIVKEEAAALMHVIATTPI